MISYLYYRNAKCRFVFYKFSSEWYSVVVRWDNADDEVYGPWDLQPKAKNRKSGSSLNHLNIKKNV